MRLKYKMKNCRNYFLHTSAKISSKVINTGGNKRREIKIKCEYFLKLSKKNLRIGGKLYSFTLEFYHKKKKKNNRLYKIFKYKNSKEISF